MSETINARLMRGEIVAVGTKLYSYCKECGSLVQINKRFFGSLHICGKPTREAL